MNGHPVNGHAVALDEQAYLRLVERMETDLERAGSCNAQDLARLLHFCPRIIAELIRLREIARSATARAALLEQGQTLLSPANSTHPQHA